MKKLIAIVTIAMTLNNVQAAVECEKLDGRWYPKNEIAKDIASKLGVKTCSGKRFKQVVEAIGEKSNVTASKKNMDVKDVVASLKK